MARDVMVVLVAPNGGGTLTAVEGLVRIWRSEGRDVTLLAAAPLRPERLEPQFAPTDHVSDRVGLMGDLELVDLAARPRPGTLHSITRLIGDLPTLLRMSSTVRRHARDAPDAALVAFLPGTAIMSLVACLGLGRRVVVCERNDPERQPMGAHVHLLRWLLYPLARMVTVNAPAASGWAHRIARGRPVQVVPNPPPTGVQSAAPATSRTVLAVGRLVEQKDHATLVEAFARAAPQVPDDQWRLAIVGDGPLRESLVSLAAERGVAARVDLVGNVDDTAEWYARCAVFVLPSRFEGTSNALAEAKAAGLPCIVSDAVHPYDNGRTQSRPESLQVFPVGDIAALERRLVELMTSPALRMRLGAAAREDGVVAPATVRAAWDSVLTVDRPVRRTVRGRVLRAGKVVLGIVHPITAPLRTDLVGDVWSWGMRLRFRLRPPRTFPEKIRWKMAHDRDPLLTRTADKWEVRSYVEEQVGAQHLARAFGVFECADEVLASDLPTRFVIKATHGSSATLFVDDRFEAGLRVPRVTRGLGWPSAAVRLRRLDDDRAGVVQLLNMWVAARYDQRAFRAPEWSYRHVPPRLIVEELLSDEGAVPADYKFWCVLGAVEFVSVHLDRLGDHRTALFDRCGAPRPGRLTRPLPDLVPVLPDRYPQMVALVESLAEPFDFVRVDLYALSDGRIIVGELTHSPKRGRLVLEPPEAFADVAVDWHPERGSQPRRRSARRSAAGA